jgi:hypothetical protein
MDGVQQKEYRILVGKYSGQCTWKAVEEFGGYIRMCPRDVSTQYE